MSTLANTTQFSRLDIVVQKGDTLDANNATFTVKDEAGDNIDLSGYDSGFLNVYDLNGSLVLEFLTSDTSLILANGTFQLAKTASYADALAASAYLFRCAVTTGSTVISIAKGQFIINPKA
jgi:hypothetical protein